MKQKIDDIEDFVLNEHPRLDDVKIIGWRTEFRKRIEELRLLVAVGEKTAKDSEEDTDK